MKSSLFGYTDYKEYLKDYFEKQEQTRGLKLRVAEYILCQPSYLSQVLNGRPDFTLEQASRLSQFLHHSPLETRYFVLLIEYARAGTQDLKEVFLAQIKEIQRSRFDFKKRLKNTEEIPESARHRYYSTWFYSAIHVALSVPGNQSPEKLAERFRLPISLVVEAIRFLEEIGLVENKGGAYKFTKRRIHLEKDSDFIYRHHINWRSQALQSVEKGLVDDLHYSNVVAISEKDFQVIKDILMKSVEDARQVIAPSKEEDVYALTLDFFKL